MGYKYELHLHTAEVSRCAECSAAGQVEVYRRLGYTGICITDHFFGGSNSIPPDIPWEEKIHRLASGYENAKKAAEGTELDVFFGWEYTLGGGSDFLILGLDVDWLLHYPDQLAWKAQDYFSRVQADGGYVIHAHPFAEAKFIECIRLFPRHVDAVEVINGARALEINQRAVQYAESYGLLMTGGTDAHSDKQTNMCGIEVPYECHTIADIIQAIRNGDAKPISETQMELLSKHE